MSIQILRPVLPYFPLTISLPPGENPSLVARHHGSTLPWTIPQEQNPQGKADEDPKEPKVKNFQYPHEEAQISDLSYISYKSFVNTKSHNKPVLYAQAMLCKYFFAAHSSIEEKDREVVSY